MGPGSVSFKLIEIGPKEEGGKQASSVLDDSGSSSSKSAFILPHERLGTFYLTVTVAVRECCNCPVLAEIVNV